MKVNFDKIKIQISLFEPCQEVDIQKQLADNIYKSSKSVEEHSLALRLFDNKEIEITDSEKEIIKKATEGFVYHFKQAILDRLI